MAYHVCSAAVSTILHPCAKNQHVILDNPPPLPSDGRSVLSHVTASITNQSELFIMKTPVGTVGSKSHDPIQQISEIFFAPNSNFPLWTPHRGFETWLYIAPNSGEYCIEHFGIENEIVVHPGQVCYERYSTLLLRRIRTLDKPVYGILIAAKIPYQQLYQHGTTLSLLSSYNNNNYNNGTPQQTVDNQSINSFVMTSSATSNQYLPEPSITGSPILSTASNSTSVDDSISSMSDVLSKNQIYNHVMNTSNDNINRNNNDINTNKFNNPKIPINWIPLHHHHHWALFNTYPMVFNLSRKSKHHYKTDYNNEYNKKPKQDEKIIIIPIITTLHLENMPDLVPLHPRTLQQTYYSQDPPKTVPCCKKEKKDIQEQQNDISCDKSDEKQNEFVKYNFDSWISPSNKIAAHILELPPHTHFRFAAPRSCNALCYILAGYVYIGPGASSHDLNSFYPQGESIIFNSNNDFILIHTGKSSARVLCVVALPIWQVMAHLWPFSVSTVNELYNDFLEYFELGVILDHQDLLPYQSAFIEALSRHEEDQCKKLACLHEMLRRVVIQQTNQIPSIQQHQHQQHQQHQQQQQQQQQQHQQQKQQQQQQQQHQPQQRPQQPQQQHYNQNLVHLDNESISQNNFENHTSPSIEDNSTYNNNHFYSDNNTTSDQVSSKSPLQFLHISPHLEKTKKNINTELNEDVNSILNDQLEKNKNDTTKEIIQQWLSNQQLQEEVINPLFFFEQ